MYTGQDIGDNLEVHPTPPPSGASPKSLPIIEQQHPASGHAVPPAVAGHTPPKPSAASSLPSRRQYGITSLLLFVLAICVI